jgi:demethylspheroidene O-methyltransferase
MEESAALKRKPATEDSSMSLSQRFRNWRNRLVGSKDFQDFANRNWPLRIIARRRASDLFSTVSGFIHAQILSTCVETGLFGFLRSGPRNLAEIARHLGTAESQALRLLEAAQAIFLVGRDRDGNWHLDDAGAVVDGNPGIEAMIRHHAMLYRDLANPVALLREPERPTEISAYWAYVRGPDVSAADSARYSALMTASQDMLISEVLECYSFSRHRVLMDVGGGEGAFLAAAGKRHPSLSLRLFDLPSVAALPKKPGQPPIERFGGDFFADPLPRGADCITLMRVLCDHEDHQVVRLLRNVRAALEPGGRLVIAEPMAGTGREERLAAAYFGFYFLAMRSGRCRSPAQIQNLLKVAGFGHTAVIRTRAPLAATIVSAGI